MDKKLKNIVQALQEKFSTSFEEFRGEAHVFVNPEHIIEALTLLRDKYDFELLSAMTATDYWPQQSPRFHVMSVQLRVPVDGAQPTIPTATGVYEVANWRERELQDMFGITAEGHPDPRKLLLPEDWKGHPLRRDYPLGYEEPQFTFNFDDIDLRKLYAKE
jgi:NADH-quinone oxidoreductase subunit C